MTTVSKPSMENSLEVEAERLIAEADAMERQLGSWLRLQHTRFQHNRHRRGSRTGLSEALPGSLWRALVLIWATAPDVRRAYSEESRDGLISALQRMDAPRFMSLVDSFLEEGTIPGSCEEVA